jgi:WD40 repeat protein
VALSEDGKHALSGSTDNALKLWNVETARVLASFTGESSFLAIACTPDGRRVVAGDRSGRVHLLDVLF